MRPLRLAAASAALILVLPAAEAAAQFATPRLPRGTAPMAEPPREAPPGLPGLTGRRDPAPIPADPDQNLAPNEALFDAINRGDLPAARDAVSRGADVDSRNVLGLTPLESAVDQGRTQIMFYLLSVRGAARGGSGPPPDAAAAAPPANARGAAARRTPPPEPARVAAAAATEAPAAPPTPRLWAGDGGAAIPDIGFLGFDAGRPVGVAPPPPERGGTRQAGGGAARGGRG
jgi:hypothetical protein